MYSLATVRNTPILTVEEEIDLFTKYKEQNCLKSAEKIIVHNLRYVANMVRQMRNYGLPDDDLFQEGVIGLMKAVKAYDLSKGIRFISFAGIWIRGAILEYIESNVSIVKSITTKAKAKLFYRLRSYTDADLKLTRADMIQASNDLNVPIEDVEEMYTYFARPDASIDVEIRRDNHADDRSVTFADTLEDTNYISYDMLLEDEQNHKKLDDAIQSLEGRYKDIFVRRRLSENPPTRTDLALEYGVSQQRIEQIENKAFKKVQQLVLQ
jgi:RNA polymerase sigma-32 factor